MQAQMKWDDFTKYKELMFEATGTPDSPWIVIKGNKKNLARLEAMRFILNRIDYDQKNLTGVDLNYNPEVVTVLDHFKRNK